MFEIGNSLRDARLKQGLDFSQVELATKIRAKYVRAIEEEQFDALPAETYVKGFLRTYADHLGLDGQLYVDEYASRFVVDELVDVKERRRAARRRRDHGFERRAVVLALVGIAALSALVIGAWKFGGSSPSAPSVLPPASAPTAPQLRFSGPGTYIEIRRGSASGGGGFSSDATTCPTIGGFTESTSTTQRRSSKNWNVASTSGRAATSRLSYRL